MDNDNFKRITLKRSVYDLITAQAKARKWSRAQYITEAVERMVEFDTAQTINAVADRENRRPTRNENTQGN